MIKFDQIYSNWIQFDQVCAKLFQFNPINSNLIQFDQVWANLFYFIPIWSSLIQFEPILSCFNQIINLMQFEGIWRNLNQFYLIWIFKSEAKHDKWLEASARLLKLKKIESIYWRVAKLYLCIMCHFHSKYLSSQ